MSTGPLSKNIRKVLVANRGEIAVRIIRACRDLGIGTVAVYSDADRQALHTRYADEAIHIGAPPPRESYLRMEKILDAAKKIGADAIHPGYGFLAENADFAGMVGDAGLIFIGPSPHAIEIMGDKHQAREAVKKYNVPLVPGTEAGLSDEELIHAAEKIGFPIMVKAVAGGGGKGMRPVFDLKSFPEALRTARSEAESSFGNGDVYIEKLLVGARHIEFQILADTHGNTIHLGERECSIQRRNQKLVEEAPSVFVDDDLRQRMGKMAISAAQSVNYVNAGTIECLVDKDKNFYFLEMNTRLQVEHPVTELVTGIDLVKEQIRIARGRRMTPTESVLNPQGWAIECRINAEDPYNNFVPSIGLITASNTPKGPGVRVDSGVFAGYEITPYYDSMIAKLITFGETRAEAMARMRRALSEYVIMGVRHNIPFHINLMNSFSFIGGQFDTRFIEERFRMNTYEDDPTEAELETVAIAATLHAHRKRQLASQVVAPAERDTSNWKWVGRYEEDSPMKYTTFVNNQQFEIEIERDGSVMVNGKRHAVDWLELPESLFSMIKDNKSIEVAIDEHQGNYSVLLEGRLYEAQVLDQRAMMMLNRKGGLKLDSGEIHSPMPGLIVNVLVNVGDEVEEGQTVVILESMKMQNELKAPIPGTVQNINCNAGDTVDKGALLLVISGDEEE